MIFVTLASWNASSVTLSTLNLLNQFELGFSLFNDVKTPPLNVTRRLQNKYFAYRLQHYCLYYWLVNCSRTSNMTSLCIQTLGRAAGCIIIDHCHEHVWFFFFSFSPSALVWRLLWHETIFWRPQRRNRQHLNVSHSFPVSIQKSLQSPTDAELGHFFFLLFTCSYLGVIATKASFFFFS